MNKRLYVGNLSYNTTETHLESLFSEVGPVTEVTILYDRYTSRPKGFGFVEMGDETIAASAIGQLDGREVDGRRIKVAEAKPRRQRQERPDSYTFQAW